MKKSLLTIILIFAVMVSVFAQETSYQNVMKTEIAKLDHADSLNRFQQSANAFSRISQLNPKEWQPYYYGALAYIYQGLDGASSLEKRDEALAKAEELIKKAEVISPDNAEIIALEGFKVMAEVSADPASRGQTLSGKVMHNFSKALKIDPKNPRAAVLMAQMEFGMARFFNSGTEKACDLVKLSQRSFEAQNEETLKAALLPTWGKNLADKLSKVCQ
ncbi:hypothetical protein L0657_02630 [Dyadobacter sp. CY345]|uniref:hypothetical protein n=1 Tax=Dyadobacter sp. CY345 TaxID=2909335 RepID=UPI001F20DD85|nr:hypothetical protein [Dyadobacter sp. CY345]MCF2442837.1 hypothetical protein [Dyadobacter sp. CY345]